MTKQRNWAPLAGLLLGALGVFGYFALVGAQMPALTGWLEVPSLHLGLVAAGLVVSFVGVRRAWAAAARYRGRRLAPLLGALNLALAGLFCWYLFVGSYDLPVAASAPQVGAPAPAFSLLDQHGAVLESTSLRGRNLVLVFYRGFW